MIAYTNHALDHLLSSVLNADITKKIVRLGSSSADPQVSQYSIHELEKIIPRSGLHSSMSKEYGELKVINARLGDIISVITSDQLHSRQIAEHVNIVFPDHYHHLDHPPKWITSLFQLSVEDEDDSGPWVGVGSRGELTASDCTIFGFWRSGKDIQLLEKIASSNERRSTSLKSEESNRFSVLTKVDEVNADISDDLSVGDENEFLSVEDDTPGADSADIETRWTIVNDLESYISDSDSELDSETPDGNTDMKHDSILQANDVKDSDGRDFLRALGCEDVPCVPSTARPIHELLESYDLWRFSMVERRTISDFWIGEAKTLVYESHMKEYLDCKAKHDSYRQKREDLQNEVCDA